MNEKEQYRKKWEKHIKDFEDSGLTIKAWCAANQLKEHQFYYWRNKFKSKQETSTSLVPIDLNKITNQINHESSIIIHMGAISLEVASEFNPSLLKDVMKVLMEVC